jgi:hypothetical protein
MGIDTRIKPLCVSLTKIWAKLILIGGHFEIQDGRLEPMMLLLLLLFSLTLKTWV